MIAAISSVPFQLNDSHTYFIPPGRSVRVDYGFEAGPFASDILVYKVKKGSPADEARLQPGDKIIGVDGFAAKRDNYFVMMRYFEFLNPATELTLQVLRGSEASRTVKIPTRMDVHGKTAFMDYNEIRRMIDAQDPIYEHSSSTTSVISSYVDLCCPPETLTQ
jgi:hypothetical protein